MTTRRLIAVLALLCLPLPAAAERLTFLHVNDLYDHAPVQGRGGLAELMTVVEAERARAPGAVLTFGGDLLSPSLLAPVTGGGHMVELLNAIGVDAATLGNHEFDQGPGNAARQMALARFPWVAANVRGGDGRPFGGARASLLLSRGGVAVGVFGLVTPATGELAAADGVRFEPVAESARKAVAELRAQGARVVVALTHLDVAEDLRLGREVAGIDLILGGHDHDRMCRREGGPPVVKAGPEAHWLAAVEVTVDGDTVTVGDCRFVPVAEVPPHPRLAPMVAGYDRLLDESLGQAVATVAAPFDSHTATLRTGQAALGNLVADSLRDRFRADIALVNGGGIRGERDHAPGTVLTRRDVRAMLPFNNTCVLLSVTGAQLRAALENGLSAIEKGAGRFPQVAGMEVVYDPARPPGSRVVSVAVGGRPLEDGRSYRLATIDYLAQGGDGYAMFKEAEAVVDAASGPLLSTVVMDHAAAQGRLAPKLDGRLLAR